MKKLIILAIVLVLIAGGVFYFTNQQTNSVVTTPNNTATTTTVVTNSDVKTYISPKSEFKFDYSKDLTMSNVSANWGPKPKVSLAFPKSILNPTTNLSDDSRVEVFQVATTSCTAATYDDSIAYGIKPQVLSPINSANGLIFNGATMSDAGAGNFYTRNIYYTKFDKYCYAIALMTHTTNIDNYPPESGIKAYDEALVDSYFKQIITSFKAI